MVLATYFGYTEILDPHHGLSDREVSVPFIDVGQGDSVLVQTSQGSVLIDGGDTNMGSRVTEYLRDAGINELTYVFATHGCAISRNASACGIVAEMQ